MPEWPKGQPINILNTTPDAPAAGELYGKLYVFWKANDRKVKSTPQQ